MNSRTASKPKQPHIALQRVKSTSIKAIGYHPKSNTLRIEFLTGGVYEYPDVSAEEHKSFIGAESHGQHFHQFIRGRVFRKLEKAA